MRAIKEILHTADGIGDRPMQVTDEDELHERIALLEHTFRHTFKSPLPKPGDWDCERCTVCGLNIRDAIHNTSEG